MRITLRLFADFEEKMPPGADAEGAVAIEVAEGACVGDVLDRFGIPHETAYVCLLDGRHAKKSAPLAEGVELAVFPAIVGG